MGRDCEAISLGGNERQRYCWAELVASAQSCDGVTLFVLLSEF